MQPGKLQRATFVTLAAWAAAAGACSSGVERSPMDGEWSFGDPNTSVCASNWSFRGDEFDHSSFCSLTSGPIGLEIVRGLFVVSGDRITLTKTRSTCPSDTREPVTLSFQVRRNVLTLASSTMINTYERGAFVLQPGSQAQLGCFDGKGNFMGGELLDLP